jgi:Domain of unknown function (DUF222)/HNH endonuclease
MSTPPQAAAPSNTTQALAMVRSGLAYLATCEASALPTTTQAETLIGLESAEARLTAARASVLAAFCAGHGYEADGQYGPKPWLRAFTRVTKAAAGGAVSWMRRLTSHPAVTVALAAEAITTSWAREICAWTDRLPADLIQDADKILLAAAAGGADLPDLAILAAEMIQRSAVPDGDDGEFADRTLWLETTLAGAGRLTGDLTPGCAAALTAVLEALGSKAGPEDTRSLGQRRHDALEEACHRLMAANMVPGRDGEPLRVYAHLDLAGLAGQPDPGGSSLGRGLRASLLESRWSLARVIARPGAWCLTGPDAEAAACDTTVIPVVTGQVDWALLDELVSLALPAWPPAHGPSSCARPDGPPDSPVPSQPISPATRQRLRDLALQHAVSLLSGPAGLAVQYRARALGHPLAGPGQVLDLGAPTPVIPTALRRAVTLRDRRCRFPGCAQRPSFCQIHHLIPRARGGPTALPNLALLCRFHHLIVIHRWGWTLTCHPDGTTAATGPDGRTLHSHSPPQRAA